MTSEPPLRCSSCGGPYSAFNPKFAQASKPLAALLQSLRAERALKSGTLFRCTVCNGPWYRSSTEDWLERVPTGAETLLLEWGAHPLELTPEHAALLRAIGATEADLMGNQRGLFRFPCSVTLASREVFDPAILLVTKQPPISSSRLPAFLYSPALEIRASRFALPRSVRAATSEAEEEQAGFSPTAVAAEATIFLLNGARDVLCHPTVDASQLRVLRPRPADSAYAQLPSDCTTPRAYVYADWFPEIEALRVSG